MQSLPVNFLKFEIGARFELIKSYVFCYLLSCTRSSKEVFWNKIVYIITQRKFNK